MFLFFNTKGWLRHCAVIHSKKENAQKELEVSSTVFYVNQTSAECVVAMEVLAHGVKNKKKWTHTPQIKKNNKLFLKSIFFFVRRVKIHNGQD